MKKLFRKIYIRLQYIKISLQEINKPKLGDIVIYKNIKCSLIQGVSNPYWDLLPLTKKNLDKPNREIYEMVHLKKIKLRPIYKRFIFSFFSTYRFLMVYWYDVDVRID